MKSKNSKPSAIVFYTVFLTLALVLPKMAFADTIQLPKTGQGKCYDIAGNQISCVGTGQDGDIQAGVAWPNPRFTDNGDGTITDNLTGLMWTKNANLFNGINLWQKALDYIAGMNAVKYQNFGYKDWHLPNVNELKSLVDYEYFGPSLPQGHPFSNTSSSGYWSSSSYACTPYCPLPLRCAWEVDMSYGSVDGTDKSGGGGYFYVWPVRISGTFNRLPRTGQITNYYTGDDGALQQGVVWPNPRFVDNGDGTVTDKLTVLMWTKNANLSMVGMSWQKALDYVASMNKGSGTYGYNDWRLPNINEIKSLTNAETTDCADWLNGLGFIDVQSAHYWSSTSFAHWAVLAWTVEMRSGSVFYGCDKASYNGYVWPVRSVESIQTLIKLSSFTATPKASKVIVQWSTEAETDNAGFNIYRAETENGNYTKINGSLILAQGSSTQGAAYEFVDNNVQNRKTYYYKLEDIDLSGTATMHGPVNATPRLIYGMKK